MELLLLQDHQLDEVFTAASDLIKEYPDVAAALSKRAVWLYGLLEREADPLSFTQWCMEMMSAYVMALYSCTLETREKYENVLDLVEGIDV